MLPTLPEVKMHLRLDESETAEDAHLQSLIDAAADYASQYVGRPIPWQDGEGQDVAVPHSVRAGILLIAAGLYENRESEFVGVSVEANPAVTNMLHFYRVGLGV